MELDDMKVAWHAMNERVGALETLARTRVRERVRERELGRVRRALGAFAFGPAFDVAVDVLILVALGSFLYSHVHELRFFVPAAILHALVIVSMASSIRQLVLIGTVDYGAPVVRIQRQLARARAVRIRTTKWLLLFAPLIWTPLAIVAVKGLLGVDSYRAFGIAFIWWNVGFGVVALAALLMVARHVAVRGTERGWYQRLLDDIGGRNLTRAISFVNDLARFERE
jgi:hypothetical protein